MSDIQQALNAINKSADFYCKYINNKSFDKKIFDKFNNIVNDINSNPLINIVPGGGNIFKSYYRRKAYFAYTILVYTFIMGMANKMAHSTLDVAHTYILVLEDSLFDDFSHKNKLIMTNFFATYSNIYKNGCHKISPIISEESPYLVIQKYNYMDIIVFVLMVIMIGIFIYFLANKKKLV